MITQNMKAFGVAIGRAWVDLKKELPGASDTAIAVMAVGRAVDHVTLTPEEKAEVRVLLKENRLSDLAKP